MSAHFLVDLEIRSQFCLILMRSMLKHLWSISVLFMISVFYSLFLVMEKGIKTKLKEAKRLYQQCDFIPCRELLKEVSNVDRKNYNALVLNGACCDHLGLEDIGVDYFFDAIQLEPDNSLAWQGLFQLGTKNTDRYHASLVWLV
ncbi:hypothetical protein AHF37_01624 [Paragonimus kellicotti]|nr:hypothetical protein AHF37_01624 [Paragonimus kellicotti]